MLAQQIDPKQLVFVDLLGAPTPPLLLFGPGRSKGKELTARCLVTGARTRLYFRA
jgi:hypothetical protein